MVVGFDDEEERGGGDISYHRLKEEEMNDGTLRKRFASVMVDEE